MIEIHGRLRPKFAAQLIAGHQLARRFQQHDQQLKWLVLKPDTFALLPQFAGLNVGFEGAKTQKRVCWLVGVHGIPCARCYLKRLEPGEDSCQVIVFVALSWGPRFQKIRSSAPLRLSANCITNPPKGAMQHLFAGASNAVRGCPFDWQWTKLSSRPARYRHE